MGSDWRTFKVSEFADVIGGGTPKTKVAEYWNGSIPWLTPKDLSNHSGRYISKGERNISKKGLSNSSARLLPPKTVLLTSRAPVGYLAIAKNELTTNQGFRSLLVKDGFSPEFIYYLLFNNVDYLKRHASGSTFQELSGGTLKELEFEIPEKISEQRAIAHILGSLDDKIELNRRMNQTLEATARAIFKSWFVDFDPVRAKAEGRPTGLPDDIAALFPDSFEDSELGEIPKEWEVSRLGNIADVNWGDTSVTKKSYIEEGFLAYSAKGPDGFLPYHDYDRTGVVVSAIGANSGHTWLARGKWSCIKNTIRFWSIDESISTEYLYHATFGKHNWPLRGSAQPFISQGDARSIKVLSPSNDLAKVFGDFVRPFYEKAVENTDEAHTLASLRDTLLPKLISGEMRVLDAEKFVEEAGV
jgi:type I restriction enzyme S subunit